MYFIDINPFILQRSKRQLELDQQVRSWTHNEREGIRLSEQSNEGGRGGTKNIPLSSILFTVRKSIVTRNAQQMYGSAMMHIGTLVVIFIHYGKYANTVLLRSCVSMVETELRYFIVQRMSCAVLIIISPWGIFLPDPQIWCIPWRMMWRE